MDMNKRLVGQPIEATEDRMDTISFGKLIEELTGMSSNEFYKDFINNGESDDRESNLE